MRKPSSFCLLALRLFAILAALFLTATKTTAAVDPGEILIGEMNCVACHAVEDPIRARLASRPSPRLDAEHGIRLNPQWVQAFLENPQGAQPGTLMPDLLGGLDSNSRSEAAELLTHYLVSLRGAASDEKTPAFSEESAQRGRVLYHTVGCVACHAPQDPAPGKSGDPETATTLEKLQQYSTPLGDLHRKYGIPVLAAFLTDPLKSRPGGRMPSLKLTKEEARDIATYLLRPDSQNAAPTTGGSASAFVLDTTKVARGREMFAALNCAGCHQVDDAGRQAKPMATLNGRQPAGCLGTRPKAGVPKFTVTDRQRVVMLAQLGNQPALSEPLTPEQQITRTMTTLNCYACHSRERRGGIEATRRDYFTARSGNDAPDEARIPPVLKGVGARFTADWLRSVLVDGKATRPDMLTRMPLYGEPNVHQLPSLYIEADKK